MCRLNRPHLLRRQAVWREKSNGTRRFGIMKPKNSAVIFAVLISAALFFLAQTASALRADNENVSEPRPANIEVRVEEKLSKGKEKIGKIVEKAVERVEKFELPEIASPRETKPSLFVGPQGEVRILGAEITALAGSSFDLKVWGIALHIETATTTEFIPAGTSFSSLQISDKVNVRGIMRDTGVVTAKAVHNVSDRNRMTDVITRQIRELLERLRELQAKLGLPLTPFLQPATSTAP